MTQLEKKKIKSETHIIQYAFVGDAILVIHLFGGDPRWVTYLFGVDAIWDTSSTRVQTLRPFLGYKMDSNENFICHSVIVGFKGTKY